MDYLTGVMLILKFMMEKKNIKKVETEACLISDKKETCSQIANYN